MTDRDDIIRMAREAGFVVDELSQKHQPNCISGTWHLIDEGLIRFAALVRADEREACAEVCDKRAKRDFPLASENSDRYHAQADWAEQCAKDIRARG